VSASWLVSIARAFARDPQLILFDEATSYIDSQTEKKIQEALNNLMIKRTSIVVAHRLSTIRNADKIIVLSKGRIIETGTHSKLMDKKGFYFRLNQLQNQTASAVGHAKAGGRRKGRRQKGKEKQIPDF